jgi:hypothetical protein
MTHIGLNHAYEVTLGPAAIRTVQCMSKEDRGDLAEALRTELLNGPNASREFRFDSDVPAYTPGANGTVYTATPLSFGAYTAVHRPLTGDEINRLRREQGRSAVGQGFYVIDILSVESAFGRPGARPA